MYRLLYFAALLAVTGIRFAVLVAVDRLIGG